MLWIWELCLDYPGPSTNVSSSFKSTFEHTTTQVMQLFRFARTSYQRMGVRSSHSKENDSSYFKTFFVLLPVKLFLASSMAFLLFQANSIDDFKDSFYMSCAVFASALNFSIIAFWKMRKMLEMTQSFEKIIEKSKIDNILISIKEKNSDEIIKRVKNRCEWSRSKCQIQKNEWNHRTNNQMVRVTFGTNFGSRHHNTSIGDDHHQLFCLQSSGWVIPFAVSNIVRLWPQMNKYSKLFTKFCGFFKDCHSVGRRRLDTPLPWW